MEQRTARQPIASEESSGSVQADAARIAGELADAAGASACYLAIVGVAGSRPRLLVSGGEPALASWSGSEISSLLRRTRAQPMVVEVRGWPGLVVGLASRGQLAGTALLVYSERARVDMARAVAAASLAAHAIEAERQVGALHLRAEELEERAHLREIQVSRNLIRGVIDSIPMGLALLDTDGTLLAANRSLAERFGVDPAVLVGMSYSAAIGSWEGSPAAHTFMSGGPERARRVITHDDGRQTLLEIASIPLLDNDGRALQAVEVWEDITERVSLQTQLVRIEKLAAIGQLAASIAHEVGNPLQAIQGFLSLFLEQCDPATPNRRFLELAEDEIERIVQVLERLRDLYRPRADVIAPVDVNELVEHVLLLTHKQLERSRVRVLRELAADLPQVHAVSDQLKQVVLNLVLNAVDAMRDGGMLQFQTSAQHSHVDGAVTGVMIAITDTGVGIPPDQLPRIFDGLHTSKERGMGLGLYTSKAIVDRHNGRLSVQSAIGEGTTFVITLPIGAEELTMTQAARILVVDDEPSVRVMLEAALRPQGYRVECVASGNEALNRLDQDEYDLLLLDLRLGDSDGIDILRETKLRWPATEVILLTAHGSINSAIAALRHGAFDYLLKPAQVADIRERVERGLMRRRTAVQRTELLQRISDSARALGVIDSGGEPQIIPNNSDRIEVGGLILDLRRHRASLGPQVLALTRTEFALLTTLAQQPDTALSYSALSEAIYGRAQPEDEARALLRPHIARLRHKLESTGVTGVTLVSIRSMGYMLRTE